MALNPVDAVVSGTALNTEGFVGVQFTESGLGLNTFGFLWPCYNIWVPTDSAITTVWVSATFAVSNLETCVGP